MKKRVNQSKLPPAVGELLRKLKKEQDRLSGKLAKASVVGDGRNNAELIDDASDIVNVSTRTAENGNRKRILRAIEEKIAQIEKSPDQVYVCQRGSQCVSNGKIDQERLECESSMASEICGPCAQQLEDQSRRLQVRGFHVEGQ